MFRFKEWPIALPLLFDKLFDVRADGFREHIKWIIQCAHEENEQNAAFQLISGRSCTVANGGLDQTAVDWTAAPKSSIARDVSALDSLAIPSLAAFTRYCPDDFAAGFASGHIWRKCLGRYRASEKLGEAGFASLEFFLIERYRLFARRGNKLFTGRVHHSPYQLRKVTVIYADPELFAMDGFEPPVEPTAHTIYSERVDVSIYPMALVDSGAWLQSDLQKCPWDEPLSPDQW
jgi:hypothetical protein